MKPRIKGVLALATSVLSAGAIGYVVVAEPYKGMHVRSNTPQTMPKSESRPVNSSAKRLMEALGPRITTLGSTDKVELPEHAPLNLHELFDTEPPIFAGDIDSRVDAMVAKPLNATVPALPSLPPDAKKAGLEIKPAAQKVVAQKKERPFNYRVTMTMVSGKDRFAEIDGGLYRVGQRLKDGAMLAEIKAKAVLIKREDGMRWVQMVSSAKTLIPKIEIESVESTDDTANTADLKKDAAGLLKGSEAERNAIYLKQMRQAREQLEREGGDPKQIEMLKKAEEQIEKHGMPQVTITPEYLQNSVSNARSRLEEAKKLVREAEDTPENRARMKRLEEASRQLEGAQGMADGTQKPQIALPGRADLEKQMEQARKTLEQARAMDDGSGSKELERAQALINEADQRMGNVPQSETQGDLKTTLQNQLKEAAAGVQKNIETMEAGEEEKKATEDQQDQMQSIIDQTVEQLEDLENPPAQ